MESVHSSGSQKVEERSTGLQQHEKKKHCTKKRIKLLVLVLVVLVGALACALLITPQPEPPQPPRRIPDRYTHPELLTPEDRELFSDIRTSFVPTGSIALPPAERLRDIFDYEGEANLFNSNPYKSVGLKSSQLTVTGRRSRINDRNVKITSGEEKGRLPNDDFIGRFVRESTEDDLKIKFAERVPERTTKQTINEENEKHFAELDNQRIGDDLKIIVNEDLLTVFNDVKGNIEDVKPGNALGDLLGFRLKRDSPPENLTTGGGGVHMWQGSQKLGNGTNSDLKEINPASTPEILINDTQQSITEYLNKLARDEIKDKVDGAILDDAVHEIVETAKIQLLGEKPVIKPETITPSKDEESEIESFWNNRGDPEMIRRTQANIMKRHMDHSANPCDDFYQYACGNWPQLNPIPADKAGFDTFEMLRENLDVVLKDLLSSDDTTKTSDSGFNGNSNFLKSKFKRKTSHLNMEELRANLDESDVIIEETTQSILPILNNDANPLDYDKTRRTKRNIIKADRKSKNTKKYAMRTERDTRSFLKNIDANSKLSFVRKHSRIVKRKAFYDFDTIINNEYKIENENDIATVKAKHLYKSCMNYEILERRGHKPLLDLLKVLGDWPILNPNWEESKFDWLELMAYLRLYNNDILLSEWVGPDIKNSDEFVIQFDQTSLGLPTRDYFLQPSNKVYLDAYKNYLIKIATLLGSAYEDAVQGAEEIIHFETKLAKITSAPEDRRNISELYQRLTVKEISKIIPKINWDRYLNIVLNTTISPNQTVVIFALKYAEDLVSLIEQTDKKTIANYLLWRFVRHRVNNLDDKFQEAKQRFYYILFGREQAPPRWKNCVAQVNSNMGMALGAMFVKKYFDENSKNDTLIMTRDIQESFRELLNLTMWIDDETKMLATDKVDTMTLRIGYPDFILNHDELNDKYKEITVRPDTYFENTLNILKHLTRTEQGRLGQIVNKTQWNTAPAVVNAYYSRNKNQIMFPAGILQPPFYHRYFPKSLNFGGIGVVIGHEITHGFDDKGRLFDKFGNLHRWWHDLDIKIFHKKAQCLIDQYSEYTVSEVSMSLDGVNTQGENIADNGGIKQAFRAYQHWLKQNGDKDETLPGLNATNTQLFFLNFAQVWCGAMRPEAMKNKLKTAVHSPGKFRVIGTVSNSEDFARVFHCPEGSPMNPIRKCNVW